MESRMTEATKKLVGEAQGSLLAMVKNEIGYTWNCTGNVDKLRIEVGKLKSMLGRVQQRIKLAKGKGDELLDGVLKWVDEAGAHITKAQEFLQEEADAKKAFFNLQMCVNLKTLRHYGKEAINKVSSLEQHQKDGAAFESDVSIPTPSLGPLELNQRKDHNELDSQKSALGNIIKAIEDESIQIIGIYGTGGVGKTTLAKEAAAMVKHLFDDVVFVTVSQPVNATLIKTKVEVAAKRIKRGEIILIILDDVWRELKLDEVGIPCGTNYSNCKILLTSRKSSVCVEMNAGSVLCVDKLPINEAWIFFKRVVGEKVETNARLKQVALKVAKGCGGLPLILQVVGKALKNERIMEWEAAFDRIQNHATPDIDPNVRLAFAHLKLSYDYLDSKEVKSCFLLCSMFPEDYDISLETLAFYGVGLQFFEDLNSLEDARNRVRLAVKILKSSCLLLDAKDEFTTKMHDIVREVALLIASKDNNKFLVKAGKDLKEWEPRNGSMESYTGISLMENDICKLAVGHELKIPLLNICLLQENRKLSEISEEFILAVKEGRVIDFGYNNITSLPKSLKLLTRLRMLNLGGNRFLRDVSILGELIHLEILILNDTGITEIPQEIGKLVNLRVFHAECCRGLSHIAPGVLSKLRWLEELHIGYHLVERGSHNGLGEIDDLSKSAFLKLCVPHIYLSPRGDYLKTLRGFYIQISQGVVNSHMISRDRKTLLLEKQHIDISDLSHVKKLTEVSNVIKLNIIGRNDYNNIMPMMYCEGSGLKFIYVSECHELLCLLDSGVLDEMQSFHPFTTHEGVKENRRFLSEVEHLELLNLSNLNVILSCPDQYISLINLVNLVINNCPKLEKLLTVSVAQGLVKLQKLEIYSCTSLKEVILHGDEETIIGEIVLPCLAEIVLIDLNNLESFFPRNAIIKYPSLVKVEIKNCFRMKNWGYGTHDTPNLQFINNTKADGSIVDEILAKYIQDELWREEVFQKIKAMKDLYLHDLNDMHQKILGKLQYHDSLPQQPKNEQLEKLQVFKNMLERFMAFLQIPKQSILANYKDKLSTYEKHIVNVINSNRRKPWAPQQQGQALPPQHMQSQQPHSQSHDNQMSFQMQTGNMQGSMGGMQQKNMGRMQQNSVSLLQGSSNTQQNIMPPTESGDWRAQLPTDSRQRIVNKILETLKRHLPFSGHEGLQELKKIAVRFEENVYTAATSQSDYLRKISLKMVTMETRSQNPMPDHMQANNGLNLTDPGSQVMPQVNNQGQKLSIPMPSQSGQLQQMMLQNVQNNIGSTGMQGSSSLSAALPTGSSLSQSQQPHSQLTQVQSHDNQMSSQMQTGIAGSVPGNESRAAVGENLVAMEKRCLQARTLDTQDGTNGVRKMKHSSAMPLDILSPAIKRRRVETNHGLLEEIKEINRELIDTVVNISDEDVYPAGSSEGGDGTIVKCSFSTMALGPNLNSQYASAQMSPIQSIRFLVPANYPNCSPILLDMFPADVSNEYEDLSTKTMSMFIISLESLSQPISLKEIAKTWDVCARAVSSDYAQQSGGGTS